MNPVRRAIFKKTKPAMGVLSSKVLTQLRTRKPLFKAERVNGSVRIEMNGESVGSIEVADASQNVGISLQSKKQWGGRALSMVFAKEGQLERKRVAYVCAFVAYLFDDRPSEERKAPSPFTDPKAWYDSFSPGNMGEISESYALQKQFTDECRTLIDVFHHVAEAIKSARREDVAEALERVQKDLPFLTGKLSEEEWLDLYRRAVVDGVHEL